MVSAFGPLLLCMKVAVGFPKPRWTVQALVGFNGHARLVDAHLKQYRPAGKVSRWL